MSNGRTVRVGAILCLLSGLWVVRVEAATQNLINGVHLKRDGKDAIVEIASQRAPNFTTFKQDTPRRVIVDVAECGMTGVPARIKGDGRLVADISTAHFGNSPHGISRVVIGLLKDAEYRVTIRGGSLFVHISEGTGGLLVSAGVPTSPPRRVEQARGDNRPNDPRDLALAEELAPPRTVDAGEPAGEPAAEPEPAAKSAPLADVASPEVAIEVPPQPRAEPPAVKSEAEPLKVAMATETPQPKPADETAAAPAPARDTSVAQQDEKESGGEGDEVEEVEEVEEVPVEVVDEPAGDDEEAVPPPPTDNPAAPAAGEDAVPAPAEETAPPPPPPAEEETAPPPPPPAEEETTPPPAPEEEAVPPPPPPSEESVPSEERVEISSALKNMTWVGFQQTRSASRVYVKTNEPVTYRVIEEGDNLIVLELENTRIPLRNNRRFLDTHFFDSAVTLITPHEIEGVTRSVRIEIQLRNHVPYKTVQEENMVYVNFERPQ